jgi:hypothetical protein
MEKSLAQHLIGSVMREIVCLARRLLKDFTHNKDRVDIVVDSRLGHSRLGADMLVELTACLSALALIVQQHHQETFLP